MVPKINDEFREKAAGIRLLALDVDGILTTGHLLYGPEGEELKIFNTQDGLGIKQLMAAGVTVALITGRDSEMTARRARELNISHVIQGRDDKRVALQTLAAQLAMPPEHIAYMGDDLVDLSAIQYAGLGVTVPNAHWFVRQHADHCTEAAGGQGAVRELTDLILLAQNALESTLRQYLEPRSEDTGP
ncbi:KdsC family phosphatase [Marinobacter sp.]|uniref:KdsC family phosphatase n=1 Tax=Marinobacter sp. TaxID=50741 RepID=UPI00384E32FE